MHTPWGYEVEELPPLIDSETFDDATGGIYAGDPAAEYALNAASDAIRNACGWHVAPSVACKATLTPDGRLAKLPARLVTSIESVTDNGVELTSGQYEARHDGLIRRTCFQAFAPKWDGLVVEYTAGFETAPDALVQAVVKVAEMAMTAGAGVASETAGNVSISYQSEASALASLAASRMMGAFAPYRLVSAHAA